MLALGCVYLVATERTTTRRGQLRVSPPPVFLSPQSEASIDVPLLPLLVKKIRSPRVATNPAGALVVFPWPHWRRPNVTLEAALIYETPFVRVESHTVLWGGGSKGRRIRTTRDWVWIDIAEQINVLVTVTFESIAQGVGLYKKQGRLFPPMETLYGETDKVLVEFIRRVSNSKEAIIGPPMGSDAAQDELYLLFRQSKYGLETESLAVVGGLMEVTEIGRPLIAAKREVHEELGISRCDGGFHSLGSFRTDTNRGGGTVSSFLARRCWFDADSDPEHDQNRDLEEQKRVVVSRAMLKRVVMHDPELTSTALRVDEVKWSNTIALALLVE